MLKPLIQKLFVNFLEFKLSLFRITLITTKTTNASKTWRYLLPHLIITATLLKKSGRWEKRQLLTVKFLHNSSADCFTTADRTRTQLKINSPEGPVNGQRRVNQEEEEDGGENGNTIPKIRILSTLSVDTGSRGATNTASQSWKPTFHHSFRNHDSGLDMTWLQIPIHQELGVSCLGVIRWDFFTQYFWIQHF